jgi:hypothetical protein
MNRFRAPAPSSLPLVVDNGARAARAARVVRVVRVVPELMALVALLAVAGASGCRFGEAAFTSTFDDAAFDPGGTVFSTLDAHDANLVEDTDPRVAVAMTWVVFDAQGDLSDLDGAALASMAHEMSLRDALTISFDHQGVVDEGAQFSVVREGDTVVATGDGDDVLGGVDFRLHLAPERLEASSTYAGLKPFGSRRTLEVTIDDADFGDAAPVVAGSVTLTFEAIAGRDAGNAREGRFEGTFRAPLVGEASAEKNAALLAGAVDGDGVLALPLPARGASL